VFLTIFIGFSAISNVAIFTSPKVLGSVAASIEVVVVVLLHLNRKKCIFVFLYCKLTPSTDGPFRTLILLYKIVNFYHTHPIPYVITPVKSITGVCFVGFFNNSLRIFNAWHGIMISRK